MSPDAACPVCSSRANGAEPPHAWKTSSLAPGNNWSMRVDFSKQLMFPSDHHHTETWHSPEVSSREVCANSRADCQKERGHPKGLQKEEIVGCWPSSKMPGGRPESNNVPRSVFCEPGASRETWTAQRLKRWLRICRICQKGKLPALAADRRQDLGEPRSDIGKVLTCCGIKETKHLWEMAPSRRSCS